MPADLRGKYQYFTEAPLDRLRAAGFNAQIDAAGRRGAPHRAGLPGDRGSLPLMLFAIPFPVIDPVLVQIGPFAIRWYALAYIAGIVLGWLLARRLVALPPVVATPAADRRLRHLGDARRHPRRPAGLRAVLPAGLLPVPPAGDPAGLAGRHVLPWRRARRDRRDRCCSAGSSSSTCWASATGSPRWSPIGLCLGRLANFINGELWGRVTDVPWGMVFPTGGPEPRHPSQLYEAGLEGVALFILLQVLVHVAARIRARRGFVAGAFLVGYGVARIVGEFFRQPTPSSASSSPARPWGSCCRCR